MNALLIHKQGWAVKEKRIILVAIAVTLMGVLTALAQEEPKPAQTFMRQKLTYAQNILEGVTLEKFGLVLTNAAPLRSMNMTNAFLVLGHPEYLKRITNFQASIDALTAAAQQTNTAAATRAYTRMTDACFDCHRYFRRDQFLKNGTAP